jgi:hypothetical protein
MSEGGKITFEATVAELEPAAQPVIIKALKSGLQAALKGIQDARAEKIGAVDSVRGI